MSFVSRDNSCVLFSDIGYSRKSSATSSRQNEDKPKLWQVLVQDASTEATWTFIYKTVMSVCEVTQSLGPRYSGVTNSWSTNVILTEQTLAKSLKWNFLWTETLRKKKTKYKWTAICSTWQAGIVKERHKEKEKCKTETSLLSRVYHF